LLLYLIPGNSGSKSLSVAKTRAGASSVKCWQNIALQKQSAFRQERFLFALIRLVSRMRIFEKKKSISAFRTQGHEYRCPICAEHERFPEEIDVMTPATFIHYLEELFL
jgi:hypothetical protein